MLLRLRGPNGCGKTSLLRRLAGLPAARTWPVHLAPDPRDLAAADAARLVRFAPQDPREGLVGLTVAGEFRLRGLPLPQDLVAWADRDVATLSSGQARRVALAVTLAHPGQQILLDEPGEGLDAAARLALRQHVKAAAARGLVVAVDHAGVLDGLDGTEQEDVIIAVPRARIGATPATSLSPPPVHAEPVLESAAFTVALRDGASTTRLSFPPIRRGAGLHALVGPNGSGKSTLLRHLAGLAPAPVAVGDGQAVPGVTTRLLLSHPADLFTQDRVEAELAGADPRVRSLLVPAHFAERHPLTLSSGEAQRVALAKALGRPAPLVLLDEPEAHLDATGRAALMQALALRIAAGACVLAATHDPALRDAAHSILALEAA